MDIVVVWLSGDLDSVCWSLRLIFNSSFEGRFRLARNGGIMRLLLLPVVALPQDTLAVDLEVAESSSVN